MNENIAGNRSPKDASERAAVVGVDLTTAQPVVEGATPIPGAGNGASQAHSDATPQAATGNGDASATQTSERGAASGSKQTDVKPGEITTVEGLLRYAYGQKGKRFSIPDAVFETIAARPQPDPFEPDPCRAVIDELVPHDPLMAVPTRILIVVDDADPPSHLRRRLVELIGLALARHRVMRAEIVQSAIDGPAEDFGEVFATIRRSIDRLTPEQVGIGGTELKSTDKAKIVINTTLSLALLAAVRDRWSSDRFVQCLYEHLWTADIARSGLRRQRALIADSRTPDVLRIVAEVFDKQVHRARADATESRGEADRALARAFDADAEVGLRDRQLKEAATQIASLETTVAHLQSQISDEQRSRVVDRSLHVDDYETLRTRLYRTLSKQTDLLSDGLHALRNNSLGVTEEFLERAILSLDKEIEQLKPREDGH